MHLNVHNSTIYDSQHTETTQVPINKLLSYTHTHTHTHTHTEILLNHKKNKIMPFVAKWMELEIIILLNEVSEKENKYHMISLIYGI